MCMVWFCWIVRVLSEEMSKQRNCFPQLTLHDTLTLRNLSAETRIPRSFQLQVLLIFGGLFQVTEAASTAIAYMITYQNIHHTIWGMLDYSLGDSGNM